MKTLVCFSVPESGQRMQTKKTTMHAKKGVRWRGAGQDKTCQLPHCQFPPGFLFALSFLLSIVTI